MFYSLMKRVFNGSHPFSTKYMKLTPKEVSERGVLVRKNVFEVFDTSEQLNKYRAIDFKLENILAVGAYDMLKPQVMTDTNPLSVINKVDIAVSEQLNMTENVPS